MTTGTIVDQEAEATGPWQSQLVASLPWLFGALAFVLSAWGMSNTGFGNVYYAAAVRSVADSWHNFFFASFDPAGFITVDKPPVFLWLSALSVRLLGYSSVALILPSALAGSALVMLLWSTVRPQFGVAAASVAALVLALTPISVAINRINSPEPFYILALAAAAFCILRSLDSQRWLWWVLGAGLLVGVAFNTKMLAAWVPGPALAFAIMAGTPGDWWRGWRLWAPRVAIFGIAALLASVSWMLVVDSWPASERPYVGGSQDNTVFDLAFGYNGIDRLEGDTDPGGITATSRIAGRVIAGAPGPLRLFDDANAGQIAWFLPWAAIAGLISLWYYRDAHLKRAALVLWLGWLLLFAAVFSYSDGIYHSYYTAAMAPAIAALVGMSGVVVADLARRGPRWLLVCGVAVLLTAAIQVIVTGRIGDFYEWLTPLMAVAVVSGCALVAASQLGRGRLRQIPVTTALAVVLGGLLVIPAAWSAYEMTHRADNPTLPQAGPRSPRQNETGEEARELARWLEEHSSDSVRWHLATPNVEYAAPLIAESGLSVMAIGGFLGADPSLTVREFGQHVEAGDVRYVLLPRSLGGASFGSSEERRGPGAVDTSAFRPATRANEIMLAVRDTCTRAGDPADDDRFVWYRTRLYDCAGTEGKWP